MAIVLAPERDESAEDRDFPDVRSDAAPELVAPAGQEMHEVGVEPARHRKRQRSVPARRRGQDRASLLPGLSARGTFANTGADDRGLRVPPLDGMSLAPGWRLVRAGWQIYDWSWAVQVPVEVQADPSLNAIPMFSVPAADPEDVNLPLIVAVTVLLGYVTVAVPENDPSD